MKLPNLTAAVQQINKHGALLVFPIANSPQPQSLWSVFYPNKKMNWDWSENANDLVPHMWHLREELSRSRRVVYSKWYQGRATFFSIELFTALLSVVTQLSHFRDGLSRESKNLLQILEDNSPQATRELRMSAEMEGKINEGLFTRSLKQLWSRFLVVGFGEVEEGGFPSLAVGATKLIFEEIWDDSKKISTSERDSTINKFLSDKDNFRKFLHRQIKALPAEI